MQRRRLGATDIFVSLLGLGTVKFGRNTAIKYPHHYALPTDREIKNILASSYEAGINLLDTAPAYGSSEERIGQLLENRHQWVICTKAGEFFINDQSYFDFSANEVLQSVERSLQRLKTDYIDILLIHSNGDDMAILNDEKLLNCLQQLKKQGKVRSIGISSKTIEGGCAALSCMDAVMVSFNPVYTSEKTVIAQALKQNKGVLIKKGLASGHVRNVPETIPFILNEAGVTSLIVGTITPEHLLENIRAAAPCK